VSTTTESQSQAQQLKANRQQICGSNGLSLEVMQKVKKIMERKVEERSKSQLKVI
jgi:hypothetical protein